jgi:Flp pilus assembly protein TadD
LYIRVRSSRKTDATSKEAGGHTVSAADLNIPENAKKEFDKASDLMAAEKWPKALEHLQKAIAIYPKYVAAYNNVGVVYARLGNRELERDALKKAIELDSHFAPAFTNLARMSITDHDYPEAETLLNKAETDDPNDATVLTLLANVQLLNRHYDDAIASAHKAHAIPQSSHSLVHYVAARAFTHKNLVADAKSELEIFLQEEPAGPRAEAARKEMAQLELQ